MTHYGHDLHQMCDQIHMQTHRRDVNTITHVYFINIDAGKYAITACYIYKDISDKLICSLMV